MGLKKRSLNLTYFLASGFGIGTVPFMPGTLGSLVAVPIYLVIRNLSFFAYLVVLILSILFAFGVCDKAQKDLKDNDPPSVVIDEIVGFLLTMMLMPGNNFHWIIIGFIMFRVFDIWKPWPIKLIENKVSGGIGIVMDDLVAGIYAAIFGWFFLMGMHFFK